MNGAKWFKTYAGWWEDEWIIVLSAEAQLAWMKLTERCSTHGLGGRLPKLPPQHLARQWLQGEESVRQMLKAAEIAGKLSDDGDHWIFTDWAVEQGDRTGAERQRRFKEAKKGNAGNALPALSIQSNAEEKRIEEKRTPLNPPKGGKPDFDGAACPAQLLADALTWQAYKRRKKQSWIKETWEANFRKYAEAPDVFARSVAHTIDRGWQGLVDPDESKSGKNGSSAAPKRQPALSIDPATGAPIV